MSINDGLGCTEFTNGSDIMYMCTDLEKVSANKRCYYRTDCELDEFNMRICDKNKYGSGKQSMVNHGWVYECTEMGVAQLMLDTKKKDMNPIRASNECNVQNTMSELNVKDNKVCDCQSRLQNVNAKVNREKLSKDSIFSEVDVS